jgi:hypothetical protein
MSKHTKGPWFVESDDKTPIYVSPVDRYEQIAICNVMVIDEDDSESGDWINGEQTKANARLIAAAPDLLHALQNIENDNGQIPDHAWKVIQDVIAKATGDKA